MLRGSAALLGLMTLEQQERSNKSEPVIAMT